MNRAVVVLVSVAFVACAPAAFAGPHDALIARHAAANGVPEALVRRVIRIESRGNAGLAHAGNYGLMQIRLGTARSLGYSGDAKGLLDADTNLTYAVKYLAGAYRAAGCNADRAVHYYQRGYHGAGQSPCAQAADVRARPVDVLTPRVVRIETIGAGNTPGVPARPAGRFEPARISAQPSITPLANVPVPTPAPGKLQLASIPLPPVRADFDRAAKKDQATKAGHAVRKREQKSDTADAADPIGVVSALKKFVAPDKPAKKRAAAQTPPAALSPPPPL